MNGSSFQNFPEFEPNWFKFKKILEKLGDFAKNLPQNLTNWYMNVSLFLKKLVFVWVYFQILSTTKVEILFPGATAKNKHKNTKQLKIYG